LNPTSWFNKLDNFGYNRDMGNTTTPETHQTKDSSLAPPLKPGAGHQQLTDEIQEKIAGELKIPVNDVIPPKTLQVMTEQGVEDVLKKLGAGEEEITPVIESKPSEIKKIARGVGNLVVPFGETDGEGETDMPIDLEKERKARMKDEAA